MPFKKRGRGPIGMPKKKHRSSSSNTSSNLIHVDNDDHAYWRDKALEQEQLVIELQHLTTQLQQTNIQLETKMIKVREQRDKWKATLYRHQRDCATNHVATKRFRKPYSLLKSRSGKAARLVAAKSVVKVVSEILNVNSHMGFQDLFQSIMDEYRAAPNSDPGTDTPIDKLYDVLEIMDRRHQSMVTMHELCIAFGGRFAAINSNKLRLAKEALNTAILGRLRVQEGHRMTWVEPECLIRELLLYHRLDPGAQQYTINVMGDGRNFGDARKTTLIALRVLKSSAPTSQVDSVWPLALLRCTERYDVLRELMNDLIHKLTKLQQEGLHIPLDGVIPPHNGDTSSTSTSSSSSSTGSSSSACTRSSSAHAQTSPIAAAWDVYVFDENDPTERNTRIKFVLSGDMKFLLLTMGLSGATSEHACVYC